MRKNDSSIKTREYGFNIKQYMKWLGKPEMRKGVAAAVILMFVLTSFHAVQPASASQPPTLTVTTSTQTLIADQENLVEVTVTNTGESKAVSAFMTVNLPTPGASGALMILNGSDGRYYLGDLAPDENKTVTLHIIVAKGAAGTQYQISFAFTYQYTGTVTDTRTIGFVVSPDSAKLDLNIASQNLIAGTTNSLNLTIKNVGNGKADSLTVSLTLPGSQASSSQYVLIGSDGTWYINELKAGDQVVIPMQIYVLPSASNTAATFTIITSYSDPQSKTLQQSNAFGVLTVGSVNIVILSSNTYPSKVSPGNPFSLTVTLLNTGSMTAQSMLFTPNGADQIVPLSQNKIFLGDLGVNVPSSLTLPFTAGNVTAGNYTLSIGYSYRNSLGMDTTDTLLVPFKIVLDDTNTTSTTQQPTGPSLIQTLLFAIIIIVIVAIVVYLLYRRKSRSSR